MDLWQALARLRHRPRLVALVVALSAALGVLGWTASAPTYSISIAHVLRAANTSGDAAPRYSVGSYESGMLASMIASNLTTVGSGVEGVTLTVSNSIVTPPTNLPLITITVTAPTPDAAVAAVDNTLAVNRRFLVAVAGSNTGLTVSQVNPTHPPVQSAQPRIRAAGAGVILGLLGGTLLILTFDTLARMRAGRGEDDSGTYPATPLVYGDGADDPGQAVAGPAAAASQPASPPAAYPAVAEEPARQPAAETVAYPAGAQAQPYQASTATGYPPATDPYQPATGRYPATADAYRPGAS